MIRSATKRPEAQPINVGAEQIGAVYAKALLGAAEKQGGHALAAIIDELDLLVNDVLRKNQKLEAVLASALIKPAQKTALLERIFQGKLSPLLVNFLGVLAAHGRLDVLRSIEQQARKIYDEMRGLMRVKLKTATPIAGALADGLTKTLRTLFGSELELEHEVDPDLIGGVVLRVGDTVYDGSVATQLKQVRQQMITRSVHEIQSRRDRFRHSGGN